jgi:predicted SprT family Zn-dependent metalloprotease
VIVAEALVLARDLVRRHGLDGWTVGLDRAKTRAGACRYRTRQITLSAHLTALHSEEEVRDTVLHEIAHALVGAGHGHDEVWRARALAVGASGQRCVSEDSPQVAGDWVGRCAQGHEVTRHRRPARVVSCSRCSRSFSADHLLEWTYRGRRVPMHPHYVAQLKALRDKGTGTLPVKSRPPLWPGDLVTVTAPGRYHGIQATVMKRGRTRYHVRVLGGVLTVPFSLVEPATRAEPERRTPPGGAASLRP